MLSSPLNPLLDATGTRTIFVKGTTPFMSREDILNAFAQFGKIVHFNDKHCEFSSASASASDQSRDSPPTTYPHPHPHAFLTACPSLPLPFRRRSSHSAAAAAGDKGFVHIHFSTQEECQRVSRRAGSRARVRVRGQRRGAERACATSPANPSSLLPFPRLRPRQALAVKRVSLTQRSLPSGEPRPMVSLLINAARATMVQGGRAF
jgi:hypothetical protein